MYTVLHTNRHRANSQLPPWLTVGSDSRSALAVENVLSKLGWPIVGPFSDPVSALPLARKYNLSGAVLDLSSGNKSLYAVAGALIERRIPFFFITENGSHDLRWDFRNAPCLPRQFLAERLRPMLRDLALVEACPRG